MLVALTTAALYMLGLANTQGDALAFQLPATLLQPDFRELLALGAQSLLEISVFLPVTLTLDGAFNWPLLMAPAFALIFTPAVLYWAHRRSTIKPYIAFALLLTAALYIQVTLSSSLHATSTLKKVARCFSNSNLCDSSVSKARVRYSETDDLIRERDGALLSANSQFLLFYTPAGLLLVPRSAVRSVESGRF